MHLLPLLIAPLLSAVPVAPPTADVVLVLKSPRADLPALRELLTEASASAPMLNPARLGTSLSGPLQADLLDAGSLEAAGISLDAPMALFFDAQGSAVCLTAKGKNALERLDATLGATAPAARLAHAGAKLSGTAVGKTWRAGYASKGETLCIASDQPDALPSLKSAAEAMAGKGIDSSKAWKSATAGLTGSTLLYVRSPDASAALELKPSKAGLLARGRAVSAKPVLDKARDADPLGALSVSAPVAARAVLSAKLLADPAGPIASALSFMTSMACPSCDAGITKALHSALAPRLFGSLALLVFGVDATAAGLPRESYFLAPHAYLLGLKDADGARQALSAAIAKLQAGGARLAADDAEGASGWAIEVGPRHLYAGISGSVLYLANDPVARTQALTAAKVEAARPTQAGSAILRGDLTSAALRRISVLDVGKSNLLAGLYAVALQTGPLLRLSTFEVAGEPESSGNTHLELTWTLKPIPSIAPPAPRSTVANPP